MRRLLSTKILSNEQVSLLESAGWTVDQYDAISIEFVQTSAEPESHILIFTSKNGARGFLRAFSGHDLTGKRCLCVGSRASGILRERGLRILEEAATSEELASYIQERYSGGSFVYYCGNRRLNRIPDTLNALGVEWEEAIVYDTLLNPREFNRDYQGILFFSPSGVESYMKSNKIGDATGYCIGKTTSGALLEYTDRVLIAKSPDINSLIELAMAQTNLLKH